MAKQLETAPCVFGHAGDGNIHVNIMAANYYADRAVQAKVERALDELFKQVLAWGGVITASPRRPTSSWNCHRSRSRP